jgi:uncharacterized membrane protein (UPF0127 family)
VLGGIRPLKSAKKLLIEGYSPLKAIDRIYWMNKVVLIILIMVVLLSSWWFYKNLQIKEGWKKLTVGKTLVKIQVRDTVGGRSQGLSGVEKLEENEGMLFVFPKAYRYGFWMKEMKFDLDFVFIKDDRVVEIIEGVSAPKTGEQPVKIQPTQAVKKVLEVNSGWVKRNKIKVGDRVRAFAP